MRNLKTYDKSLKVTVKLATHILLGLLEYTQLKYLINILLCLQHSYMTYTLFHLCINILLFLNSYQILFLTLLVLLSLHNLFALTSKVIYVNKYAPESIHLNSRLSNYTSWQSYLILLKYRLDTIGISWRKWYMIFEVKHAFTSLLSHRQWTTQWNGHTIMFLKTQGLENVSI